MCVLCSLILAVGTIAGCAQPDSSDNVASTQNSPQPEIILSVGRSLPVLGQPVKLRVTIDDPNLKGTTTIYKMSRAGYSFLVSI